VSVFSSGILESAARVLEGARRKGIRIATAESCTGGLIAGALTAIPGSSDVFECGFVVYSNQAKTELLQVSAAMIAGKGAVSAEVARAMAEGALKHSAASIAVSCTGIAGPGGGSPAKPVGLVHLALAAANRESSHLECRFGEVSRDEIRIRTVAAALQLLRDAIRASP
jgi:nicotinamide-nucleotide amidase